MYNSETVKLADATRVEAKIMKAHSRKRSFTRITGADSVTCNGTYWDGGSRNAWFRADNNGETMGIGCPTAPPQFGGGDAPTVSPTDAWPYVVRVGTFRGKSGYVTIYSA